MIQRNKGNVENVKNENGIIDTCEPQEESKEGNTAQKIRLARKMSKIAKLSDVLRRNTSIGAGEDN